MQPPSLSVTSRGALGIELEISQFSLQKEIIINKIHSICVFFHVYG